MFEFTTWHSSFADFFIKLRHYTVIGKQLLISNDWNRVRWVVLGLLQDGACTELVENLSVNSSKGDLSNATTFNPPLFPLDNTFNSVYILEIRSVMLVFSTQLYELLPPLTFSLVHLPTPPPLSSPSPSQSQSRLCTDSVWLGEGGCWVVLETLFSRSYTLCFWPDSEPTKLLDHPKQKLRRGGDLSQINTCLYRLIF
jgi:hypothetical protein